MTEISLLTRAAFKALGMTSADANKLIEFRVLNGGQISDAMMDRLSEKLSSAGSKVLKSALRTQGMVQAPQPLNVASLVLVPDPAMVSAPGITITIGFRRLVDDEDFEGTIPFTLSGENRIPIHDVSLAHLIRYRVKLASGDVIAERILRPVQSTGELVGSGWAANPPLSAGETLQGTKTAMAARLHVDTRRPPAAAPKPGSAMPAFARRGRFHVIGQPDFGFAGYSLSAALASPALLGAIAGTLDTASGSTAAQIRFTTSDAGFAALAATLPLVAGEIDNSGSFRLKQDGISPTGLMGWVWVLSGPETVVGFRPDPTPASSAPEALIYLPGALAALPIGGLPRDVTEAELLARPDLFTDDPGTSCRPFSSTGRILGEKRFRTVLRVTQPQVALAGLDPITFEDQSKRPVDFPRRGVGPDNLIDYEADPSRFQAESVAFGHIIEHVVRYRSNGYSLGNIAHSLTLAPREKRRIMRVEFARGERASRVEGTDFEEQVADRLDAQRDYDVAVAGALNEWSRGSSSAVSAGGAVGAGGAPGPVVIGGGLAGGGAQSDASQTSHRDTTASESQRLRDAIRRYGESLRKLESTVVTESTQTESITGVSEVVQNINYTRALSIVYYEILRHLRVDTEVGAVSECVFVPMPIRRFTDARIARHRKVLGRFARGWLEQSVFRYLDDIQRNFSGSDIPDGKRADHPLTQLSGSLTFRMGIEIPSGGTPRDSVATDSETQLHQTSQALEGAWEPFASILPMPVGVLATTLAQMRGRPGEINALFRNEIAPAMARAALDNLTLSGAQAIDSVDFTSVTPYRRGVQIRVDFDVALDGSLTRRMLQHLVLRMDPKGSLPRGSYLNLVGGSINFATEHYRGRISIPSGSHDLLSPGTGQPDPMGALMTLLCTDSDNLHLRNTLHDGYAKLQQKLDAETFRYHKAIWMGLDRDELYALLDGYAISPTDGRSIASVINPHPLGVLGNSLVFATRTDWPLDERHASFAALKAQYTSGLPPADPIRISLPTSGLYARAHMDDCIAAEEHDGSFDWVFANTEPDLADFPAGMFASRATPVQGLTPTAFPETIINLQNAPAAPTPTGLGSTLGVLGTDAFRDITGLAGTQENLRAAMSNATSLAASGISQGAKLAELAADARAGKDLNAFGAAVRKAVDGGQLSAAKGEDALAKMADRKGRGAQPADAGDLHGKVLDTDGEASHSSTSSDGVTKTTTKKSPTRKPEPKTDIFVIAMPDPNTPQVLFLNFATGKSELRPKHIRYLEELAAIIGVSIDDVQSIEGHASPSGSEDSNLELGADRALGLFDRLHRLVKPLGAAPDYSPALVSSSGESGSYRSRFAHVPALDKVPGAGDPNDPVEKAVLFTLKPGVDLTRKPEKISIGGQEVLFINNFLFIGGVIYCALPDGRVKEIDRGDISLLTDNVVDSTVSIGDTSVAVSVGDVSIAPSVSVAPVFNFSLTLGNGNSFNFGLDADTPAFIAPTVVPALADRLMTDWTIKLFEPRISNARSMADLLTELANLILPIAGGATAPSSGQQLLQKILTKARGIAGDAAVPDKPRALVDVLIAELGLTPVKTLLEMVRFGQIRMDGLITAKDPATSLEATVKGRFTAPGIVMGSRGPATPGAPDDVTIILNNASYKTSVSLTLNSWASQRNFQEFSFIDNGVVDAVLSGSLAAATLNKAIADLVTSVLPDIVAFVPNAVGQRLFDLLRNMHVLMAKYAPNATAHVRLFKDDDAGQIDPADVNSTGPELRIITMTPGSIAFTKI